MELRMNKKLPYTAPEFNLQSSDGTMHSLTEYRGHWVILYFYPKDDTPGCSVEACAMRDSRDTLTDMGATVLGVSRDDASSHERFKAKYNLNYTLLSDPDHSVMEAYGAWGKKMFGKEGVLRKTFIIDPNGNVVKAYARVTPLGHGAQVVDDLKALQN